MLTLVLGGARSGKSRYAEQQALASGRRPVYLATATADDAEMRDRIAMHQQQRAAGWNTVEEPVRLAETLQAVATADSCIVVDCLTLWLTNILFDREGNVQQHIFANESEALLRVLPELPGTVIMVSNEVGQGVVPASAMARRFVDETGRLHQRLARVCDRVVFMTAGLAQALK